MKNIKNFIIELIRKPLPTPSWLAQDKMKHIFWGLVIFVLGLIFLPVVVHMDAAVTISLYFVMLIGGGKEVVYDKMMSKGHCDIWDFVATVALPGLFTAIYFIW